MRTTSKQKVDKAALQASIKQGLLKKLVGKKNTGEKKDEGAAKPDSSPPKVDDFTALNLMLDECDGLKRKGTAKFKEGSYRDAVKEYTKGVELIQTVEKKLSMDTPDSLEKALKETPRKPNAIRDEVENGAGGPSEGVVKGGPNSKTKCLITHCIETACALYGNRALCYLKLNQPDLSYVDCGNCLRLNPNKVLSKSDSNFCKYAYRKALAASEIVEKMDTELNPDMKSETLSLLYEASLRLKQLGLQDEHEAANQLYYKCTTQLSRSSLVWLARSNGFEVDIAEDDEGREYDGVRGAITNGTRGPLALLVSKSKGKDGDRKVGERNMETDILKNPVLAYSDMAIPKDSDYFKVTPEHGRIVGNVAENSTDVDQDTMSSSSATSVNSWELKPDLTDEDTKEVVSSKDGKTILKSQIDLIAMRKRLGRIHEEGDRAKSELAKKEAEKQPHVRPIGASLPFLVPVSDDGESMDEQDDESDEADDAEKEFEELPVEDRNKLELFQEYHRRKQERDARVQRWREKGLLEK